MSNAVQNIPSGGTYMDVGNFTSVDNNDDVGIITGAVFRVYRNLFNGTLDPNPYILSNVSGAKKCKIRQINDKTPPYPQNNPDDRADIITITNNPSRINIYHNNNNNTVTQQPFIDIDFFINDLEVADINRDGYNDVIVLGNLGLETIVKVFLNNGSGVINNTPVYTNSLPFHTITPLLAISDLNNEGYNDLVIVCNEGRTFVFINTGSDSYFSQTPDQYIPNLVGLQSTNSQIKVLDIYNQGGKALFISYNGTGPITNANWGVSRVNAICFNWPPPPPLVGGSTQQVGSFIRPKIQIISNFDTPDFLHYEIYKSNAASGWNFNYLGYTAANEYIDYTEYILYSGIEEAPPPNCYYAVKTFDQTGLRSNISNQLGYRVGEPICPNCGGVDNLSQNNTDPGSEANIGAPKVLNVTNFPNPFNPTTKIYYNLPVEGIVKITIYNSTGQEVELLMNEFKHLGSYTVDFDGSNLSSGIYYYRLESNNLAITNKMLLIK